MTKDTVTLNNIYEVVNRLEDKLDKRMCELEDRVGVLEQFKARILGIGIIIGAFVGIFVDWIKSKLLDS